MSLTILLVEDDRGLHETLRLHIVEQGYEAVSAFGLREAFRCVEEAQPDVVMLDQQLPDGTGLQMLAALKERSDWGGAVIMMTGIHDLELAISAIKAGAFDFIYKPIRLDELDHVLGKAIEHCRLVQRLAALNRVVPTIAPSGSLVGHSHAMLRVSKEVALVAGSDARVLLTGETGTGKEVVARAIHDHSERKGLFLAVNCAAIIDTLMESDLFGHEKGAFTGATARKLGKFELANEGTLFLDEVGEMNLGLQAKLLRVLQQGTYERIGGTQTLRTTARIIAATNRDLDAEVRLGRFREDLLYRLKTVAIHLPPLRERREDIQTLVAALLVKIAASLHKPLPAVSAEAMTLLLSYDWPGNVRELENVLTQAVIRARTPLITVAHLAALAVTMEEGEAPAAQEMLLSLEEVEARHIRRVLAATQFHKGRACQILGISRPALDRKISKFGLGSERERAGS